MFVTHDSVFDGGKGQLLETQVLTSQQKRASRTVHYKSSTTPCEAVKVKVTVKVVVVVLVMPHALPSSHVIFTTPTPSTASLLIYLVRCSHPPYIFLSHLICFFLLRAMCILYSHVLPHQRSPTTLCYAL